ncbi:MAG: YdcF family protein [Bryobacterales bacterium]|nr:YdcF family protein [Bryobacterales bacterium]
MRRFLLGCAVFLALLFLFREPLLREAGHALVRNDGPEKADAVVVLAGGSGGDRILKGAELVRQGYAPIVLMSGPASVYGLNECQLAIPFAVQHGYPESYFACVANHATSTRDEAQAVVAELKRRGVKKFLLVTSDYHTGRAARTYSAEAQGLQFRVVASRPPEFDIDNWWKTRDGIKGVYIEWSKTLAYLFDF